MTTRRRLGGFLLGGVVVTLLLAGFASPWASSQPDGLEKVATEQRFDRTAKEHATADGPLADYGVAGVENERISTGIAGFVGVLITFAVGTGAFFGLRLLRRTRAASPTP